ncbi:hypothetical protein CFOL_v3_13856 [Cephalotus follicularis]|uniref:DUF7054 domain-containing protein n=1 Tax=Cephalotus follicularis TaxID=3775 RepID=A0A1Q3BR07_CEPFO|nr:hypothetical protein CFOL_v3_13856 [Cephalotus follicularis]
MTYPSHTNRRQNSGRNLDRTIHSFPPYSHTNLVSQIGSLNALPVGKLTSPPTENSWSQPLRLTKLLVNVNIERSVGSVQVLISPDNTVKDLVKAALAIYVKEKRRPLLKETDPVCFCLHYSQFSLQSLKPEEKLTNLGSRNFFMCSRPSSSVNSSCIEET